MTDFDEANVLFEVVLPNLCRRYASELEKLAGMSVEFRLRQRPPRAWHVLGGPGPWVHSGPVASGTPDIVVALTPELAKLVAHGGEPDIEAMIRAGQLEITGDLSRLSGLGLSRT